MDLFGSDVIIGNFKLSDYGMMLGTFGTPSEEEELGMDYETIEEFVGNNPVPVYLGAKHSSKLMPQATIIKNPCSDPEGCFSEHECREVLRELTGFPGYKKMEILSDAMEDYYYFNVHVTKASYHKTGGRVTGIILSMECDSQFAWSKDYTLTYSLKAGDTLTFINQSDDLYSYLLPQVTISADRAIDKLEIIHQKDNGWTTELTNIAAGETVTMNSKTKTLLSSLPGKLPLNDFNMHFIRLLPGRNDLLVSSDVTITLTYNLPRKVGFL